MATKGSITKMLQKTGRATTYQSTTKTKKGK